ncbi:ABC transporter permease subunit [Candidatus Poriferisocius sp.]|uniref:ABC transporter permease subunit n=1 Tax=Candidatus Poriferisocius sp. TaxID=3101276 RepID=UPI003B594D2D
MLGDIIGFTIPLIDFEVPRNIVTIGLIRGLTYALLGIGITLVYRSSRVINFAHGEMGALPALLIPIFVLSLGWPYPIALTLALLSAAVLGGLFEFSIVRPLRNASRLTVLVATIGAAQLLFFSGALLPKGGDFAGKSYPTPFTSSVTIGTLRLNAGDLTILVAVPLLTIGLALFLGRSRLGKASRAAAENGDAARLAGIPVERVSMAVWTIAGLLAGISAILIGPTRPLGLSEALGPNLMLRALAAAMLGGLSGSYSVFAAGLAIGLLENLIIWNFPIGGALDLALLIAIAVSFLVKRGLGAVARGAETSSWSLAASILPLAPSMASVARLRWVRTLVLAGLLVFVAYVPTLVSSKEQFFFSGIALFAVFGLSLVVLTGFAGQVSMGQFAFVAVGAAFGGRLYQLGIPHGPGLVLATVIGGGFALVVGIPALRIRGLFLAVITLAFSVATSGWLLQRDWLNHRGADGSTSMSIPRPVFLGIDFDSGIRYYWVCLGALVMAVAFVHRLRNSGLGRRMIAVRDNEPSAASVAVSPRTTKLLAFMISGMIAAFGGFLYGGLLVNFSGDIDGTFGAGESLSLVVMTVFGGVTTITGAILGAVWVQGIPRILGEDWGLLSSGIGVLAVLLVLPGGLASLVFKARDRWVQGAVDQGWLTPRPIETPAKGGFVPAKRRSDDTSTKPLTAAGIKVSYGGIDALSGVSIEIGRDEIVGIMGPNGAGKTTLFDVLSGHQRPTVGEVYLEGKNISRAPPQACARRGLGRSFQQARLFEDMRLVDVVNMALEREFPTNALSAVVGTPGARRKDRTRNTNAMSILAALELDPFAHHQIGALSTGSRRLAELACASALGAHVILLDEPTAGLTPQEVESFTRIVTDLRATQGVTVVVIDHDVPMMRTLVDRLYVLEAGRLIAHGPPSILDTDQRVIAAYVGSDRGAALSKDGSFTNVNVGTTRTGDEA